MNEIWNREELYVEIWEKPLVKVAAKYNISAVALGKVCRKLQIPLPGRGYWTKKEFGKKVEQTPLPAAKDLPVVRRMKEEEVNARKNRHEPVNENDPEIVRIESVRKSPVLIEEKSTLHKVVSATRKVLREAGVDSRGILVRPREPHTLDIRVSKKMLERAIRIMNAFIVKIESEGVTLKPETNGNDCDRIDASVFGQTVSFAIVERSIQKSKKKDEKYSWAGFIYEYEPSGLLEFRVGGYSYYGGKTWREGKTRRLEDLLSEVAAGLLLIAREKRIAAENRQRAELEQRRKEEELKKLAEQIKEEEKKVRELNSWVRQWARAKRMRRFIAALERKWKVEGADLSSESPDAQRILWMKEQADRIDLMTPSPTSILDRKDELPYRFH